MCPGTPQVNRLSRSGLLDHFLWAMGRRQRFAVKGDSMEPLLRDGDVVFVRGTSHPTPGDVVVAHHPFRSNVIVVKALHGWDELDQAILFGVNPKSSSDSRSLGGVPREKLVGVVTSTSANPTQ